MTKAQKIKNLIIIFVFLLIFSSTGFFAFKINKRFYNAMLNNSIISSQNNLLVHFISVGQGDAIAINLPDGKVALIDAGLVDTNVTYTNYLKDKVLNVAKDDTIDYLFLSHADMDHSGGAMRLINKFKVENVVLPLIEGKTDYYQNLLKTIKNNKISIKTASEIENLNKNYDFDFYVGENSLEPNEMSYVIKLSYLNKSFLFAGDISSEIEMQLIERYGKELDCDILKVAHHGSKYSSCDEFLQVVTPKISVISCGKNSYGHPTSEAISNILECGSKIYRTDINGNVAIMIGDYYNLAVVCGNFKTINMTFYIETFIVFVDIVLLCCALIISIKKEKRKKVVR